MDKRIARLGEMDCNVAGALERMAGDEEFYIECLHEALENPNFEGLQAALAAADAKAAFDCAHALKGVLGNVGLTPMYHKTFELVEPLRAGNPVGLEDALTDLLALRCRFREVLA